MSKLVRRNHTIRDLESNVSWGGYDYVLVDYRSGKSTRVNKLNLTEPVTLDDAKALLAGSRTKRERQKYRRLVNKLRICDVH